MDLRIALVQWGGGHAHDGICERFEPLSLLTEYAASYFLSPTHLDNNRHVWHLFSNLSLVTYKTPHFEFVLNFHLPIRDMNGEVSNFAVRDGRWRKPFTKRCNRFIEGT